MGIDLKYLDAILYIVFTAISFVFLDQMIAHINPIVALVIMSFCGIVVFNVFNIGKAARTYCYCWQNKSTYLIMSIALAIDWWTMVLACYFSDPFVAMAALFIAVAVVGFARLWFTYRKLRFIASCSLLLFASVLLIVFYKVAAEQSVVYGFILGAIAGCAFYVYVASSEKLATKCKFTSLQILATRFWLLFISALIGILFIAHIDLTFHDVWMLILISFGSLIIPIYFNQQSIAKLGAAKTSIIISLVPPITYAFYIIIHRQINVLNTLVCLLITMAILLPKILTNK